MRRCVTVKLAAVCLSVFLFGCDSEAGKSNGEPQVIMVDGLNVVDIAEFDAMFRKINSSDDPKKVLAETPGLAVAATVTGRTMLHTLARSGDADAVAALLDAGVSVDLRDYENETALHDAVNPVTNAGKAEDRLEVVKVLLAAGADPDAFASSGTPTGNARSRAARYGESQIYELLLEAGGDADGLPEGVDTITLEPGMSLIECRRLLSDGGYEKQMVPTGLIPTSGLRYPVNPDLCYYFGMYGGWILLEVDPEKVNDDSAVERIIVWHIFDTQGNTIPVSYPTTFQLSRKSHKLLSSEFNDAWFNKLAE